MMKKALQTPEQITAALNVALANSDELEGDCRKCKVRSIGRVSEQEAQLLGRNWNVAMVNGECRGDCMSLLKDIEKALGVKYEAIWP